MLLFYHSKSSVRRGLCNRLNYIEKGVDRTPTSWGMAVRVNLSIVSTDSISVSG
jgi:hypothetical protein